MQSLQSAGPQAVRRLHGAEVRANHRHDRAQHVQGQVRLGEVRHTVAHTRGTRDVTQ